MRAPLKTALPTFQALKFPDNGESIKRLHGKKAYTTISEALSNLEGLTFLFDQQPFNQDIFIKALEPQDWLGKYDGHRGTPTFSVVFAKKGVEPSALEYLKTEHKMGIEQSILEDENDRSITLKFSWVFNRRLSKIAEKIQQFYDGVFS